MSKLIHFFDYLVRHADRLLGLLILACVILTAIDLAITKHPHFAFQNIPAFYGLMAISAYAVLLILAKLLSKALRRPEDYYDE